MLLFSPLRSLIVYTSELCRKNAMVLHIAKTEPKGPALRAPQRRRFRERRLIAGDENEVECVLPLCRRRRDRGRKFKAKA
jgi:hypothetical protein